jgi:hypothetical protein
MHQSETFSPPMKLNRMHVDDRSRDLITNLNQCPRDVVHDTWSRPTLRAWTSTVMLSIPGLHVNGPCRPLVSLKSTRISHAHSWPSVVCVTISFAEFFLLSSPALLPSSNHMFCRPNTCSRARDARVNKRTFVAPQPSTKYMKAMSVSPN